MKGWLAGYLALLLLFSCCAAPAEGSVGLDDAGLQETLFSAEGDGKVGSIRENIGFLADLMEDEEVLDLLKNPEVSSVLSEITAETLSWLYHNPSVAREVMTELGISEKDQRCIVLLVQSAKRMYSASNEYSNSEEGQELIHALKALQQDESFIRSLQNLLSLISSREVNEILQMFRELAEEARVSREQAGGRPDLAGEAERVSAAGMLIGELIHIAEAHGLDAESGTALIENEHLRTILFILSSTDNTLGRTLNQEIFDLLTDRDFRDFVDRQLRYAILLVENLEKKKAETGVLSPEEVSP